MCMYKCSCTHAYYIRIYVHIYSCTHERATSINFYIFLYIYIVMYICWCAYSIALILRPSIYTVTSSHMSLNVLPQPLHIFIQHTSILHSSALPRSVGPSTSTMQMAHTHMLMHTLAHAHTCTYTHIDTRIHTCEH